MLIRNLYKYMKSDYAQKILIETKKNYDIIADGFSRTRQKIWPELLFLKDFVKSGDKVLDLGCGNGRMSELFDKGVEYVGVDGSERLIEIANRSYQTNRSDGPLNQTSASASDGSGQAYQKNFVVADGFNLPFEKETFDTIFSVAVLHHIPSDELRIKFLKETHRALKEGGMVIFTVWNLWQKKYWSRHIKNFFLKIFGLSRLDLNDIIIPFSFSETHRSDVRGPTPYIGRVKRYHHAFTKRSLENTFSKAGFDVEKVGYLQRNGKNVNYFIVAKKEITHIIE